LIFLKIFVIIFIEKQKERSAMKKRKFVVYMVTYKDDFHRTHITFVQNFSSVKFLAERFGEIHFEVTDKYYRKEDE
jgi:hypothetical protein